MSSPPSALGRPDVPLEPLHQRQVVGVAAKSVIAGVGKAVNQARAGQPGSQRPPVRRSARRSPPRSAPAPRRALTASPISATRRVAASSVPSLDAQRAQLASSSLADCRSRSCRRRRSRHRPRRAPATAHSEPIVIPITSASRRATRISAGVRAAGPQRLPETPPSTSASAAAAPCLDHAARASRRRTRATRAPHAVERGQRSASSAMKSSGTTNVPGPELGLQAADRADRQGRGRSRPPANR